MVERLKLENLKRNHYLLHEDVNLFNSEFNYAKSNSSKKKLIENACFLKKIFKEQRITLKNSTKPPPVDLIPPNAKEASKRKTPGFHKLTATFPKLYFPRQKPKFD